ncbi:hypothetical protein [Borrelia sp. A-FGy1]|uniref:hypothetical protein n=1 Tax=Borrelia sp. A-FGy1 TaxID=2608247 RepID=UPI001E3E6050|nr:hypothetical protein [Borrelia sp. A-FGy1]
MNIFLLVSLPLVLRIYTLIKYPQLKKVKQNYIYLMIALFGITIYFSLYLTEELILYKALEINYKTKLSLAISIFIKEHLYYYIFPLLTFIFFFTFNSDSALKKKPIFLIYFAFSLTFSKNLELIISNSKVFSTYEYIKIPILHIIKFISTAIICERGINFSIIHNINGYKLILIPLLLLEAIITTLKVLILINMQFYALSISTILLVIIALNRSSLKL